MLFAYVLVSVYNVITITVDLHKRVLYECSEVAEFEVLLDL